MTVVDHLAQDWQASARACTFAADMTVFLFFCALRVVAVTCALAFSVEVAAKSFAWLLARRRGAKAKPPAAKPSPAPVPTTRGPTSWSN